MHVCVLYAYQHIPLGTIYLYTIAHKLKIKYGVQGGKAYDRLESRIGYINSLYDKPLKNIRKKNMWLMTTVGLK